MSGNLLIREVSKTGFADCVGVIRKSFETVELTAENYTALDVRRLIFENDNGNLMFGLYEGNKTVGFVELDKKENEAVIKKLCVLPEYRHKGNGERLVRHAVLTGEKLGYKNFSASVRAEDINLENFFSRLGFKRKETRFIPSASCRLAKLELTL